MVTGRCGEYPSISKPPSHVFLLFQANWVYHISPELAVYSDLFSEDNITGKTLFLLTGDDLLQIGIYSIGHRKELLV